MLIERYDEKRMEFQLLEEAPRLPVQYISVPVPKRDSWGQSTKRHMVVAATIHPKKCAK